MKQEELPSYVHLQGQPHVIREDKDHIPTLGEELGGRVCKAGFMLAVRAIGAPLLAKMKLDEHRDKPHLPN